MTPERLAERRTALATASLVFGVVGSMSYLCERLYERLRHGKSDPRLIMGEQHAMFYWRAFLAVWWGSVIAILIYRLLLTTPGDPKRRSSQLTWAGLLFFPLALLWAYRFP